MQHENILRLAVLHEGRITEERLFRVRERVTVGQSPRATMYIPKRALPARRVVFDVHRGRYRLRLGPDSRGRIAVDDAIRRIESLDGRWVTLDERARGRLELAEDTTLLFQMVKPPPRRSKPCLPASAKGGLGHAIRSEQPVLMTLLASLFLHAGMVGAAGLMWEPDEAPEPILTGLMPPPAQVTVEFHTPPEPIEPIEEEVATKPEPPAETGASETTETTEQPTVAEAKPEPTPKAPPRATPPKPGTDKGRKVANSDRTRRKPRRVKSFREKTILHVLDGPGKIAGRSKIDSNKNGRALETAFDVGRNRGVKIADSTTDGNGFPGGPKTEAVADSGPKAVDLDRDEKTGRLRTTRVDPKRHVKRERSVARVLPRRPKGKAPSITINTLSRLVRKRRSGFKACYERRLRTVPKLKGKVVISLTLRKDGRLARVGVAKNTTGDSVVAQCIANKLKGIKVDAIEGVNGTRTLTVPIVLTKDT